MIHYDNQSWWGLVFRYRGTILETTWLLVLCIVVLLITAYWSVNFSETSLGNSGHTIFGSTMSYLLVFRAHSASERYWQGRGCLTQAFLGMREFVMLMCVAIKGGAASEARRESRGSGERAGLEDANDIKASMARVNCVRWALAFVVSLKLHTRICHSGFVGGWLSGEQKWLVDFDRIRLRGLTTRQEFEELNDLIRISGEQHVTRGSPVLTPELLEDVLDPPAEHDIFEVDTTPDLRQPLAILIKMRLELMRHVNEPYGMKERFLKDVLRLLNQAAVLYESITTVMLTPIPFPYVHLCKVLLLIFLVSMPFVIEPSRGVYASVALPSCVAMSLLGIDAIATELEDPFGDDPNDHNVVGAIAALEAECMALLDLCGDTRARGAFRFCPIPESLRDADASSPTDYLCLCSQFQEGTPRKLNTSDDISLASGRRAPQARNTSCEEPREARGEDDPCMPLLVDDSSDYILETMG